MSAVDRTTLLARSDSAGARPLSVLTAFALTLTLLSILWAQVDPRQVEGVLVWIKPLKFSASFVVLFATLLLVERRLPPAARTGRLLRGTTAMMAAAMVLEMGYIFLMAARAEPSHFNDSTPTAEMLYRLMGVGAVLLGAGVAVFGGVALADKDAAMSPALRFAVGWGFIVSFLLTLVTAGTMSTVGVHVGPHDPTAATLPILGWSMTGGDLRPAHFLALHAMQAIPLVGLLIQARRGSAYGVLWAIGGYCALTVLVFAQALAGRPLVSL